MDRQIKRKREREREGRREDERKRKRKKNRAREGGGGEKGRKREKEGVKHETKIFQIKSFVLVIREKKKNPQRSSSKDHSNYYLSLIVYYLSLAS